MMPAPSYQPSCSAEDRDKFKDNDHCGLLQDQTGPFAACIGRVESSGFYQNCLYDTCANAADSSLAKQAACGSVEVMAAECAQNGFSVDWRSAAKCRKF